MAVLSGGCHCGRVRFEVEGDANIEAVACNCSICRMTGGPYMFVAKTDFNLLQGEDALQNYQFNTGVAQHYFCRNCGIKSFYVPRSHPEDVSVNVSCLDPKAIESLSVAPFDGENWEKNIHKLSPIND